MTEVKTSREALVSLIKALQHAQDLLMAFDAMPRDRALAFAKRQKAPIGINVWMFLMARAEDWEEERAAEDRLVLASEREITDNS